MTLAKDIFRNEKDVSIFKWSLCENPYLPTIKITGNVVWRCAFYIIPFILKTSYHFHAILKKK